ncbi:hypothetical protein [Nitratidesulfovibrio sp. 1201_IL3209]|uniref:hypothetical protein n=1 Tax=Nitratidesulfovibrio sp. 1201_IL3209 TaxID=3084053 RepID=UPI002FDABF38
MIYIDRIETQDVVATREISRDEMSDYLLTFPALLWRIEIARSRIELLNARKLPVLEDRSGLFMKSPDFRRRVVLPEDLHFIEAFMEAMKRGDAAETIVRVCATGQEEEQLCWLKVAGWSSPRDPRYYMGYLMDVSDRAEGIRSILEKDAEQQMLIDLAENPTLIVDFDTRQVLSLNTAAASAFMYPGNGMTHLDFGMLHHPGMTNRVHRLFEEIVFARKWEGKLEYVRRSHATFSARTSVRLLTLKGRRLLRVSLTDLRSASGDEDAEERTAPPPDREFARLEKELHARLKPLPDIAEILAVLHAFRLPSYDCDGLLFSDIHQRRNKVFVHWAGEPFTGMPQGEMFPFDGTIAQDIVSYKLDSLIVDDTLDSIKAIDWALFIPRGIRSYFAKPFYRRGVLRAVLILCSRRPAAFPTTGLPEYSILFDPFDKAIQAWRTRQRHQGA